MVRRDSFLFQCASNNVTSCVVCFVVMLGCSVYGQDQASDQVASIVERWSSNSKSVVTSKLRCRHITITSDPKQIDQAPSRDAVNAFVRNQLFSKLHLPDRNSALQKEWEAFRNQSAPILSGVWIDLDIADDGMKLRNDSSRVSPENEVLRRSRVRSSEEEIHYDSRTKQAIIADPVSRVRMDSLADVRYAPQLPQYIGDIKVKLSQLENNRKILSRGEHQIEFDPASGFIYHSSWITGKNTASYDYWQEAPTEFPGGIEIPAVSARIFYRKTADGESRLIRASVYFLETAVLNEEIPAAEFAVGVPKGTKIANKTLAVVEAINGTLIISRAPNDVDNVKDFKPMVSPPLPAPPKPRAYSFVVAANVVAIAVFVVYSLLRRKER